MSFIVTARKWRPQRFDEVVGQEHITTTLKNAIKSKRIAHAYLFTGPRGVGKTTTARILAKALNCLNPVDFEPCNECEMCKSISSAQSLDIIEIDGASNRGIDEVRTLRDSVKYSPANGKYKIYIIDEVHMLTRESFNAFLKTLEEPPAHTIFIFATTDIHKVPLTIISRCQRFDFRRIQLDTIKSLLAKIAENEKIQIDDKTLTIIAKKADGALRDAESFFDQVVSFCGNIVDSDTVSQMLNLIDDEVYFDISDAVLEKNFKAVFDVTRKIYSNGWNFVDFMEGLIEHFRNIMTVILTKNVQLVETAEVYRSRYMQYSNSFSEGDILRLLNFLNKTNQELRFAQNQKLKIEISLSHLIGLEKSSTLGEIISKLEDKNNQNSSASFVNRSPDSVAEKKASSYGFSSKTSKPVSAKVTQTETNNPQFNFDSIANRWEGFVKNVSSEKALILGPLMESVKLLSLEGNKLYLSGQDPHGKDIIGRHHDYLSQKTFEYFGKKMIFNFTTGTASNAANLPLSAPEPKTDKLNNTTKHNDPYINTITSELGGEEIS